MKGRKYERYEVKVQYRDGSVESIKYNGVNTSDYKDMIKVYNDTKEIHENDGKVESISFIGISNTGELNVFWQKKIDVKYKEELNIDCRAIVKNIYEEIDLLNQQLKHHKNLIGIFNKKEDTLLHMIENSKNNKYKSEDDAVKFKIRIFDELENLRDLRRYSKDQISDLGHILHIVNNVTLDSFINNRKEFTLTPEQYKSNTELELYYKNEHEKQYIIDKYKTEFDEYRIDESIGLIYFYSNVGVGKTKNKQKENKVNKKLKKNSGRIA